MSKRVAMVGLASVLLSVAALQGVQGKSKWTVASLPPVVIKTVPVSGDTKVDAVTTKEIRVTFSKKMADRSWSWSQISDDTALPITGEIRYDNDRRTCIAPVSLEPGKTYVCWLNSDRFKNFRDAGGQPAVPYLLAFETK